MTADGLELDRRYYQEWRVLLLQNDPEKYEAIQERLADAEARNRHNLRYLSSEKRARLDKLKASLGAASKPERRHIVAQAFGILTPFADGPKQPAKRGRRTSTTAKPTMSRSVTERALIQRINRALPGGQVLKIARGKKVKTRGLFYLLKDGAMADGNVSLGKLGRELRVLKPWERFEDEPAPVRFGPLYVGHDPCLPRTFHTLWHTENLGVVIVYERGGRGRETGYLIRKGKGWEALDGSRNSLGVFREQKDAMQAVHDADYSAKVSGKSF